VAAASSETDKPKIIVIRREKSIACQSSLSHTDQNSIKQVTKQQQQLKKSKSVKEEHLIMKQNLLASLTVPNVQSTQLDANNSGHSNHHNQITSNSSTTSGVELSSKNSTNDVLADGSSENIHIKNDNEEESRPNLGVNELKNRVFILELELDAQTKKLAKEKDSKRKLVTELKNRYETEKYAALKALDAKLNAEKLFELNKLREEIDSEKCDENDLHQRSFDCEMLNLKLKLREKADKCARLEKMLKEEQSKNTQLFSKSMEIVKKYNQEIKIFRSAKQKASASVSVQTEGNERETLREQLICIRDILEADSAKGRVTTAEESVKSIVERIDSLVRSLRGDLASQTLDLRNSQKLSEKLSEDLRVCKETKQKLESLYKIKCKSDLNKSAQIKKCQLNYELELMKFKDENNCDLVRHLEEQLTVKDSQLFEQRSQLDSVIDLVEGGMSENAGCCEISGGCKDRLEQIRDSIKIVNMHLKSSLRDSGVNFAELKTSSRKVFTPSVLFNRIDDCDNSGDNTVASNNTAFQDRSLQLQEQIYMLDKELNEMKISNQKLAVSW